MRFSVVLCGQGYKNPPTLTLPFILLSLSFLPYFLLYLLLISHFTTMTPKGRKGKGIGAHRNALSLDSSFGNLALTPTTEISQSSKASKVSLVLPFK